MCSVGWLVWVFFSTACWVRIKFLSGHSAPAAGHCDPQGFSDKRTQKDSPTCSSKVGNMGLITLLPISDTPYINFPVFTYDCTTQLSGYFWKHKKCCCNISVSGLTSALWTLCSRSMFPVSFLMRFSEDWNKDFVRCQSVLAKVGRGADTTPAYAKHIIYPQAHLHGIKA